MKELVKALLAHGANPNARLVSPRYPNDGTRATARLSESTLLTAEAEA